VYGAVVAVHARDASKHQHQVSRWRMSLRHSGLPSLLVTAALEAQATARYTQHLLTISHDASANAALQWCRAMAPC
jgi:hypothetical protein